MFRHLLVLLDGSMRAELALPVAARLARATGASLTLVRMMMLPPDFTWSKLEPPFRDREIVTAETLRASTYLKGKAWGLEQMGIASQAHVLPGLAFPQLQALIEEQGIDLIVMCSRGRISFRPHTQSSMAWRMLYQCHVPVLVLQETFGPEGTLSYRDGRPLRILVPLDGSVLAETVLAPAASLVTAFSAPETGTLHLVSVLPFAPVLQARERVSALRERIWHDRLAYLQATAHALYAEDGEHPGLSVTTSVLRHSDVAETLVRAAEMKQLEKETAQTERACDLIAVTTHGVSGLHHLRIGSITARLLQETHLPFLVVHPSPDAQVTGPEKSTALAVPRRGTEAILEPGGLAAERRSERVGRKKR